MKRVRVASSALGEREVVYVHVYPDLASMQAAAEAWHPDVPDQSGAYGITQAVASDDGRAQLIVVRLAEGWLTPEIVAHEMHHAATALYGAHVGDRISRRAHLNHHNEPMAWLFSDLYSRLVQHFTA